MTRRTSRELLIAAGVLAGGFLVLTLYVRFHGYIPGDGRALDYARHRGVLRQPVYDLQNLFASLGSPVGASLTTLIATVVVFVNVGARPAGLVLAAALGALAEKPIADFVGTTDASVQLTFVAGGYPSGHMLFATTVYGMLAVLGRRYRRPEVTFIAVALLLGMGLQRVITGAHLVDEVLGAALLGGAWLCLVLGLAGNS